MNPFTKETVYSAQSQGISLFAQFRLVIEELPKAHELGMRLFKRNLKAQYRQSFLGFAWALFPPLITASLWVFLRGNGVMSVNITGISYPVFVVVGTMLWQIFTESIQAPIKNVTSNTALLTKINIPREALLLSGIYEIAFNVLIKIGLLALIFIGFQQPVSTSLALVPVGILAIIIVGFSIGLILTPIGVLYTDINRAIGVALPFVMYLTPVIYPRPDKKGIINLIMDINPMACILPETRNWMTGQPNENLMLFWIYLLGFTLLLLLGIVIYRIAMPMIIERIGS